MLPVGLYGVAVYAVNEGVVGYLCVNAVGSVTIIVGGGVRRARRAKLVQVDPDPLEGELDALRRWNTIEGLLRGFPHQVGFEGRTARRRGPRLGSMINCPPTKL